MTGWVLIFVFMTGTSGTALFDDKAACVAAAENMKTTFAYKVSGAICVPQSSIRPK